MGSWEAVEISGAIQFYRGVDVDEGQRTHNRASKNNGCGCDIAVKLIRIAPARLP